MKKDDLPEVRENPDVSIDPPPDPPGHVPGGVGYVEHDQIPPVTPDPPLSAQFEEDLPDEIQEGDDTDGGRESQESEPTA
ncbi:MAG TPA: hypothetical protein VFR99_04825 [Marmoricola sp.]|nr:hypothetical protein [Marmoricola sp.]